MKISQREARRLKKRVSELEEIERQRSLAWSSTWFGGKEVAAIQLADGHRAHTAVYVARRLGHYVVALNDGDVLRLYAVPQRK